MPARFGHCCGQTLGQPGDLHAEPTTKSQCISGHRAGMTALSIHMPRNRTHRGHLSQLGVTFDRPLPCRLARETKRGGTFFPRALGNAAAVRQHDYYCLGTWNPWLGALPLGGNWHGRILQADSSKMTRHGLHKAHPAAVQVLARIANLRQR